MEGILVVSKKTYSLSKKKAVVEWIEKPFDIKDILLPHDFELRFVDANLKMENLEKVFPELSVSWSQKVDIKNEANKMCSFHGGMTDIAWYSDALSVAIVVESHANMDHIVKVSSLDELKKVLG